MSIAADLAKTELFKDLDAAALEKIAAVAKQMEFDEGDKLYQFGDDANDLFLLQAGRIRFSLGVSNRPDGSGAIIEPTSVFGWAALLEENPRRVATASCLEDSVVHVISGKDLLAYFDEDREAGYLVMRRLATIVTHDFLNVMTV